MANTASQLSTTIQLAVAALNGQLVQLGTSGAALATSTVLGAVQSAQPLAAGAQVQIITGGVAQVRCVAGLTIAIGTVLYLSSTPGYATTVAGGILCGVVETVGNYATTGLVTAVLANTDSTNTDAATWPTTLCRYFFIDPTNGNDGNGGYVDAAPGTTFTPATVQALALKTFEEFRTRVPVNGQMRRLACFLRSSTAPITYYKKDGVTVDDLFVVGTAGWEVFLIRGSDFTNSATDKLQFGTYVYQVGPNPDQSFTVASYDPATFICTISGATIPTDLTLVGKIISPTGNVTAAAASQTLQIQRVLSATSFEIAVDANSNVNKMQPGDTFTIRDQSPVFGALQTQGTIGQSVSIVGIALTASGRASCRNGTRFIAIRTTGFMLFSGGGSLTSTTYTSESNTTAAVRAGILYEGLSSVAIQSTDYYGAMLVIAKPTASQQIPIIAPGFSMYGFFNGPVVLRGVFPSVGAGNGLGSFYSSIFGRGASSTTAPRSFVNGSITVNGSLTLNGLVVANAAANAIILQGICDTGIYDTLDGGGNVGYGVDCETLATGSRVRIIAAGPNTVTGTLGNIKLAGIPVLTWAQAYAEGFADSRGNFLISDANGGPLKKFSIGTLANAQILGADPAVVVDGDVWITNITGTKNLCVRIAGATVRTLLV